MLCVYKYNQTHYIIAISIYYEYGLFRIRQLTVVDSRYLKLILPLATNENDLSNNEAKEKDRLGKYSKGQVNFFFYY